MTETRRLVDESWSEWLDALSSVPEERLSEPGAAGEWSVKDLMAHVVFWDDTVADAAEARASDRRLAQFDWQAANDREAALRAGWTLAASRAAMEAAHQRVLDAVERYPDLAHRFWASGTWDHYREHMADIRRLVG
jgi:hypothetical protein